MKNRNQIRDAAIDTRGAIVTATFADGATARFHAVWLRDNCQDETSRDPSNGQRLFDLLDIDADPVIRTATPSLNGGLRVMFDPDEHESTFSGAWLRANQYDRLPRLPAGWIDPSCSLFDSSLTQKLPVFEWSAVTSDDSEKLRWLETQARFGLTLLNDCPKEPGTVAEVAELFGKVRETNYGRVFDVRAEADPVNLAYTSLGLSPHTDNPYRSPVPGFQLLHCISAAGKGGESTIVDGFAAAKRLGELTPRHFAMLAEWPMRYEFKSGDAWLQNESPMIEVTTTGEINAIRFNNRSAVAPRLPFDVIPAWYDAYRAFAELLNSDEFIVSFRLEPGQLFMVNNRRVLHGRTAFTVEDGIRHLQGCYADQDGLHSTLRLLKSHTT